MKKQPKVSIVVPIYGVEKYIYQAVDSILNQTLKDIEIILVDDGGKDNCPKIIDEYAKKDKRVVVIHKKNGGYGQTCNVGLQHATGEYVAIMEPDDWIEKDMYKNLYDIATKDDVDIVKSSFFSHWNIPGKQWDIIKMVWPEKIPSRIFRITECPIFLSQHPSIWTCLYKRSFLNEHDIKFVEAPGAGWTDNPFQVQTMYFAKKIKYTDEAYYNYRIVVENPTNDYNVPLSRLEDIFGFVKKENITDFGILHNLTKRALNYMDTVLRLKKITHKKDCYKRVKKICSWLDKNIIDNSDYITVQEKRLYRICKCCPSYWRFCIRHQNVRSKLVKLHINRHEFLVMLFGINIVHVKFDK